LLNGDPREELQTEKAESRLLGLLFSRCSMAIPKEDLQTEKAVPIFWDCHLHFAQMAIPEEDLQTEKAESRLAGITSLFF
jgi:hypothetical protein